MAKERAVNSSSDDSSAKGGGQGKERSGKGAMGGSSGKGGGRVGKIFGRDFLGGSIDELKKVVHPTRQEALQATVVTLIFMAFFGIILGLLDWVLRSVIWQLL